LWHPAPHDLFYCKILTPSGNPFPSCELALAGEYTGWLVSEEKTLRETGPGACAPNEQELEQERRALRALIDRFRREPQSIDDGGFYRNVGRFIIRPLMRPYLPGDKGR
jgi:hypothetical protein